jgi:hypothetical protein
MNNNVHDIWGKWAIRNMDNEHYYRMSTWSEQRKTNLFKRIFQAFTVLWSVSNSDGCKQSPCEKQYRKGHIYE